MKFLMPLFRFFDRRVGRQYAEEMSSFTNGLISMTDLEIAELLILATNARLGLEAREVSVFDPMTTELRKPGSVHQVTKSAISMQKQGNIPGYASLAVWVHTMRSLQRSSLMPLYVSMWKQLSRGFPQLEVAKERIGKRTGIYLDIGAARTLPPGISI